MRNEIIISTRSSSLIYPFKKYVARKTTSIKCITVLVTAKMEGKRRYVLANPFNREGAVPRAKNEETSEIIVVATVRF